jgi:hypothetical protein
MRACEQAGLKPSGFEVAPDGTLRVLLNDRGGSNQKAAEKPNEWDDVLGKPPAKIR